MKKIITYFLVFALFSACDKDDDSNAQLPPATQTGENTFGCRVNGKTFVHKDGIMNCYYQIINGEYFFYIQGKDDNTNPRTVTLATEKKAINETEVLQLKENQPGNAWGGARFNTSSTTAVGSYTDNENFTGELTITKLDYQNLIVSGTFWFDVEHPATGEKVEVREGRFDAHFLQ